MNVRKSVVASMEKKNPFGTTGKGTKTYLFLSGLKVLKTLCLRKGLTLLPIRRRSNFRSAVLSDSNIYNRAIYVLLEDNIRAQFLIRSTDAKNEAINAWNAQWDAILLGALFDCEVIANIQSDCSFDRLCKSSDMHLTNPYMHGNSCQPYCLKTQDVHWLEKYYCQARELMVNENDMGQYSEAIHAMATYRWHTHPRVRLAILWSGIESLFSDLRGSLTFRLSLCIALFLCGEDKKKAEQMYNQTRSLYSMRSSAVHGGELKFGKKDPVLESAQLLLRLIKKCAERGSLPKEKELLFGISGSKGLDCNVT